MFWYEDDIKQLESKRSAAGLGCETIFYGSSTIRMWTTLDRDFPGFKPLNLGFGGSTLAACAWFFDRLMADYRPKRFVFYAGDNDLADGRHPEEIYIFFRELALRVEKRFGPIPCYFISLKPSISRWKLVEQFKYTNSLIADEMAKNLPNWHWIDIFSQMLGDDGKPKAEYFLEDGLHLDALGYQLWTSIVTKELNAHP